MGEGVKSRHIKRVKYNPMVEYDLEKHVASRISNLIHKLRVHQRELKMQNDELRHIQVELENAKDRYVNLYDFAPIAYFTLNDIGVITQANLTAAELLIGE
jgi:PAS domain-containing protein